MIMSQTFSNSTRHDLCDILHSLGDAVCIFDWKMAILAANSAFAALFNTNNETILNKNLMDISPNFTTSIFYGPMAALVKNKERGVFTLYSNGAKKHYLVRTYLVQNDFAIHIQELAKAPERKEYLITNDHLTSLPNRAAFEDDISTLYSYRRHFALTIVDVNKFRLLNDSMGLDAGNICLMEIASRLRNHFRHKIYRIGPNQFAALIAGEKEQAFEQTQKMMSLFKKPFNIKKEEYYITVSCGFNYIQDFNISVSDVISDTEFVLEKARKIKNSCVEYTKEIKRNTLSMVLAKDLKNALNTPQLSNHYQPQVDTKTGKICGAEALIRWNHPTRGIIMPNDFLTIAQEHDIMPEIDRHVFINTLKDILELQTQHGIELPISINFSSATICNLDTINFVDRGLKKTKINPALITIEITETSIMDDLAKSQQVLQDLSNMGLKIAVDDFGTGYSSMGYLVRYPTDYLKIDREFIRDIHNSSPLKNMTSNIIKMGKSLGMKIIAEGVENKEEFAYLKDFDCDIIQGYLFSKPVPKDIFAQYIKKIGVVSKD